MAAIRVMMTVQTVMITTLAVVIAISVVNALTVTAANEKTKKVHVVGVALTTANKTQPHGVTAQPSLLY